MAAAQTRATTGDYHEWQLTPVRVGARSWALATKPGVLGHEEPDAASLLLARHVEIRPGAQVVHMNCGNGLLGAIVVADGGHALLTDRNVVAVEAARRTLAANNAATAAVHGGHGASGLPPETRADVVAIRIPPEKIAFLQLLDDAFRTLRAGGQCYIAGAANEGVKSAARALEREFGNAHAIAHGSGNRVVMAVKRAEVRAAIDESALPALPPDGFREIQATLRGSEFLLYSAPGVFSWEHVDEATSILADVMQVAPGASVLDLGCGTGALGLVAALLSGGGRVCMVDADLEAVRCATRSAEAAGFPNLQVLPSDVASAVLDQRFDVVVTNPPFHIGKSTELRVPLQFIHDAWDVLSPGGRLFLVANRTLPYERVVRERFGNMTTLHEGPRFKVVSAEKSRSGAG